MAKDRGRATMNVALMEKEIRRLTLLGQRVEEEANTRRFFLAAALRKVGPIRITQDDIAELRELLSTKAGDLRVEALTDGSEGVLLSFQLKSEDSGTRLARAIISRGPVPWWKRMLARVKLWWWGVKIPKEE